MSPTFKQVIPILRIFSVEKAREFYIDYLGFTIAWEHRFAPDLPLYMQIQRDGMTLHLSEHHGDGCPGAVVYAWMTGLDALHAELLAKPYRYLRPGVEIAPWNAKIMELHDPFGNRLRLCENLESKA